MTISDADVREMGEALFDARRRRTAIEPLTDRHPDMTMADGYRVQQDLVRRHLDQGDRVIGYKLGLTSAPMQRLLGVDSPDFAPILASHVHQDGAEVTAGDFISPRLEAEIALVLEEDLRGPDCTVVDVARAVRGAFPALELVDSRIADWRITLPDTVADLASSGAIVLGGRETPLAEVDLRLVGMVFSRDGELVATGAGAAALGNPLQAVAWLVTTLHPLGAGLSEGQVLMTGALHAAVPVAAGERYLAEFDRLGAVSASIS